MADLNINGFVDDRFAAVRDTFEANLASGADIGVAPTSSGRVWPAFRSSSLPSARHGTRRSLNALGRPRRARNFARQASFAVRDDDVLFDRRGRRREARGHEHPVSHPMAGEPSVRLIGSIDAVMVTLWELRTVKRKWSAEQLWLDLQSTT